MQTLEHSTTTQTAAPEVVRSRATNIKAGWTARERAHRKQMAREMQQALLRILQIPCARAG